MVDYISLIPYVNAGATKLYLTGDSNQIGFVDMTQTAGIRYNKNIMQYN